MNKTHLLAITGILLTHLAPAATRIELTHQSANYIKPYFAANQAMSSNLYALHQTKTDIDFNQTMHVHLQQMYSGVPVWNATAIAHLPKANNRLSLSANLNKNTTLNGVLYEGLTQDLVSTSTNALSKLQQEKAMKEAKLAFEKNIGKINLKYTDNSIKTIVFVDESNQANYAFLVSFYYDDGATGAHIPTSIMDAETLHVYRAWDGVMSENSIEMSEELVGGVGGNEKIGERNYDGVEGHFPALNGIHIKFQGNQDGVDFAMDLCMLVNDDITIYDMSYGSTSLAICSRKEQANDVFWLSLDNNNTRWKADEMNGGYSPSLDAFYNATIVTRFYREWYGVPALVEEDGKTPMKLNMRVHYGRNFDNAFWDGKQMTFGDGGSIFYPLTSLDITAHEISHGFTWQHSGIDIFMPQMAALHEAFSDEAAITMQYYATGKYTWDIGRDAIKGDGALRYLDNPKQDGNSIDHMRDFNNTEAHAGAGIFNKAFYLLTTTPGWDIRKAFNVMVKANMNYWTSSMTTLVEAACGVTSATRDYGYNTDDVRVAFSKVGIDTVNCKI
jgi:pseudolysin